MNEKLQVSVSPHVRDSITTQKIMACVILALMPAACFGVVNFGPYALLILLLSVASAVASEYLYEKAMKKPVTVDDLSAVVTGLLIGMNMPAHINWWIPVLGSVFAIIVVKQLYGGLGQNFMNPALGARCFLLIAFSSEMTTYACDTGLAKGVSALSVPGSVDIDALSGATPLAYLKQGITLSPAALFTGTTLGVIGETSALCLLIGGIFLLVLKIIDWRIPAAYLGTFAILVLLTAAIRGYASPFLFMIDELCAGGIMLGSFFMATDYVTSPITEKGRVVYGIFLGVMTWLFRMIGSGAEGVSYAIILGNVLTPLIENFTTPRAFGIVKEKKSKREAGA
ncbi:MAG: RnfABCDGE type electron transport complex subunit D [Lachnospiraceae bacterium]|nr:RnfABCDGE type electron transport complex subunit D [Lachnospiraceae bacterium]